MIQVFFFCYFVILVVCGCCYFMIDNCFIWICACFDYVYCLKSCVLLICWLLFGGAIYVSLFVYCVLFGLQVIWFGCPLCVQFVVEYYFIGIVKGAEFIKWVYVQGLCCGFVWYFGNWFMWRSFFLMFWVSAFFLWCFC